MALLAAAAGALWPASARAVTCDGSELICLGLLDQGEVQATAPTALSGDFTAEGFMPYDQGGIEWELGPNVNLSRGRVEITVTGLLPLPGGELDGGKVSIFDACGIAPDDNYGVGLQKMASDYHEGHVFRFGMDDDGLADNWDAVVISSSDFIECPGYNIQAWQAGETHTILADWGPEGMRLRIDGGYDCSRPGNGDAFWPDSKRFVLAARCEHYSAQQAIARFRDFKLYALGTDPEPPSCGDGHCDPTETCVSCELECGPCGPGGAGGGGTGGSGSGGQGAAPSGGNGGWDTPIGGSTATEPVAGGTADGGSQGTPTADGTGCGCRAAPQGGPRGAWALAGLVLAGLVASRRRFR